MPLIKSLGLIFPALLLLTPASRAAEGYDFTARYKFDYLRNASGGLALGNRSLGNVDLQLSVDGDKAFHLPGASAFVYVLGDHGGRPNDLVGSLGGLDNIEVPAPAWKLYEAWVQQEFASGKVSVLAGLHDLNSEFYATETSALFLNPTYGIGTEMAGSGDNGPSIFPTTGLAARLLAKPFAQGYFEAAIFDGVPGEVGNPKGTHVRLGKGDGSLLVAEGGILGRREGRLAAGAWTYTARKPDFVTGLPARSQGAYFLYDRALVIEGAGTADPKTLLSGFARIGFTAGDVDRFEYAWSAGLVWHEMDRKMSSDSACRKQP